MIFAGILMLALTRAEIVERFRSPVVTKVNGLVQVFADCPQEMRREFQMPVADFAAGICRKLEAAEKAGSLRFTEPGLVIYLGDVRTNIPEVVVKRLKHSGGGVFTRIYLPAPGFSDTERLRLEVVKAFYRCAMGRELDDAAAREALIASDPGLRIRDEYERLDEWCAGEGPHGVFRTGDGGEDAEKIDEEYMKLARKIIEPGVARQEDVLRFASRLRLYPASFAAPFAGGRRDCPFADAVELAETDPRIRLVAYEKASLVVAYGGGRSEELYKAAEAYSRFLIDLARYSKSKKELHAQLDEADTLLNIALERARLEEQGERWR